jgi:hypothetical protein
VPATSKVQFRKIMQLCSEGKMSKEDCADYRKTDYKSLPDKKQSVKYKRKS